MTSRKESSSIAVCVVGVPGVGKSTLLALFAAAHPDRARHVVGSSIVKAIIAPDTVRDLDGYPTTKQDAVRAQAIRRLEHMRDEADGALLVDGHVTLRNRVSRQLERVFTSADETFYDALVLLTADAPGVHGQRQRDTRVRATESREVIAAHLAAEHAGAIEVAKRCAIPLLVVDAVQPAERGNALSEFLRSVHPRRQGSA